MEAESAEEEIQERLDRNRELQVWIEHELVRQRWQSEFESAEELERIRVVESEFDGLAEEVILQFLQSEPPMHCRIPRWIEVDSESEEYSLTSDVENSEQFISGCGNNLSGRPMVDSGAFTSCCPEDYAREVPIEESPQLNLKSVLGEKIQHYGVRRNLGFENSNSRTAKAKSTTTTSK